MLVPAGCNPWHDQTPVLYLMNEVVPGYEGLYEVSDQGQVRSLDRTGVGDQQPG